ncbi:translocation/assembly module TamB domain-containing protein [Acaryochloris sp. CCMEE 5410]|uniref:translocation/assembly module TamB domain-containing protein n=1 Tax=Acaryochloris sp. CCMEE 5410 TaxID=310037 RepID=UPI0002484ACA|nr:translocation/assembly module TamB domain-containing protein [Acaryochloris sp. CCMEE 5410]KAI9130309.1 translocation/assembly module TamB domain-containing protein [Acaryochloris sp. CCMEE 5410]
MPQEPSGGEQAPRPSRRLWLILCSRPVIGTALVLLGILIWGGWRILGFINEELAPQIAKELTKSLNRPVLLGDVQSYSLTGLQFGPSSVPAHTYTSNGRTIEDKDAGKVQAVNVQFDVWKTLWTRTLNLDVTLVDAELYLDQTEDGGWISTTLTQEDSEGLVKIQLDSLSVDGGEAVIDPYGAEARTLRDLKGVLTLHDNNEKLKVEGNGTLDSGGKARLKGEWLQPSQSLKLDVKAKQVQITPLMGFVPTEIPIQIRSGEVDGDFQLTYQPQEPIQLTGTTEVKDADIRVPEQNIWVKAEEFQGELDVEYSPNQQLPKIGGEAQFRSADLYVPENLLFQNGRSQRQQLRRTNGSLKFLKDEERLQFEARGTIASGGRLRTKGETTLDLSKIKVSVLAQNVSAPIFDRAFQTPVAIRSGQVDANVTLYLDQAKRPSMRGTARMKDIDAQLVGLPKSFYDANGFIRLRGLTATLEGVTARYDQVPVAAKGSIDIDRGYNLSAQVPGLDVNTALTTMEVPALPVPIAGEVSLPEIRITGPIDRPYIAGEVVMASGTKIDRVPFETIKAQFTLDNPSLNVSRILAVPEAGGEITGTARYNLLPGADLAADVDVVGLPGDAIATLYEVPSGLTIGPINAQTQVRGQPEDLRTQIAFQAPRATYPTNGEMRLRKGITRLDNVVAQVAGGTARLDGYFDQTDLKADVRLAGIGLSTFAPELKGALSGNVALNGPIAALSPETLRAQGQVNFSQGLSLLEQPLDARFRWTGRQIVVQSATAKGFRADGTIDADLQSPQGPQITAMDLNIKADDYDLRTLAALGPTAIPLTGQADLTGRITGTPEAPNIVATLQLEDLAVSQFRFEPVMKGDLAFGPGVEMKVGGDRDRIDVSLNSQFLPNSFLIRRDQAIAQGTTQGNILRAEVKQFPLQPLNLGSIANLGLGTVSGTASGQFLANLKQQTLEGSFAVDQPALNQIQAKTLTGKIRYRDGIANLDQGTLLKDESQYVLNAKFIASDNPQYSGDLAITKGNIADVVALYESVDFANIGSPQQPKTYGTAADLQTIPVGVNGPLLSQLRRFSEIQQLAIIQANQQEQSLFALDGLTGQFGGQINFAGSVKTGVNADFDIRGQDFKLGLYGIDQLVVKGELEDGLLSLQPLRVKTGESLLAFQGQLGSSYQSGQLRLQNISIEPINPFLDLPVAVTGKLNGTLNLAGNLDDPQLEGQFELVEGRLDDAVINSAQTTLSYKQALLKIDSQARINNSQPLVLKGEVPFVPVFSTVKPATDQVSLTASIRDDGLSLLSLFTDQVTWEGGNGALDVNVKGTIDQPIVDGSIRFQDAKLQAAALKQPLTNLNGLIKFDSNLVTIPRLTAKIDDGQLETTGSLPISQGSNQQALAVKLEDLDLNVQELYQGGVNGAIVVKGSALQPRISGKLQLSNGKVKLANASAADSSAPGTAPQSGADNPIKFTNLVVQIGDNVKISQPPVLSFIANGDLTINGQVDQPLADGVVRFRKGSINLATTLFSVDPRRENYARFDSRFGLDPYLNIGMKTTVTEVVRATTTDLNEFAEVPSSAIGAVQSVKVNATVDGRASELLANFDKVVTLSSRPSRTNPQIIALLGGGLERSLQDGQATQAAANIASSAAFSSVQQALNDALGSRASFRAFPVLLPNQNNNQSAVLAFGAELGFDITDRFSASVLQILTGVDEPTLFNLSYEINNQIRARSSISSEGEAVGVLEYRIQF